MQIQINTFAVDGLMPLPDSARYQILLLPAPTEFHVDFTPYQTKAQSILFLSPYQHVRWLNAAPSSITGVAFHGDFYCIEYHKKEVACNGLLFNNIYLQPHVQLTDDLFTEIETIVGKIRTELIPEKSGAESVVKAYLQLILALSSKAKKEQIENIEINSPLPVEGTRFQSLLETNFSHQKSVQFYADAFNTNVYTFSKKIKSQLGKSPSDFIQNRVILESKKLLHLTFLPIKIVASKLGFDDEHYFSRYFKKYVGVSPTEFRNQVGISVVAK